MQLNPKQSARLVELLHQAKFSTDGLKPMSPYGFDSPRAKQIQMLIEALDPAFAAELASAQEPSLEYQALQHRTKTERVDIASLPEALRAEVMLRDGEAIRQQQQAQEQAILKRMEEQAEALAAHNRSPQLNEHERMMLADSRQRMREELVANGRRMGMY